MNITPLQKLTIESIVQVFETDKVGGIAAYACISNMRGDTGGLTYGKHQTTINSGNLYLLVKAYIAANAAYSEKFVPYLQRVANRDSSLATDKDFLALLKESALKDRGMRDVQDAFFDRVYWNPAAAIADKLGVTKALSMALVYDSTVHGSFGLIRDRVNAAIGSVHDAGEINWFRRYNSVRRNWLANHSNALLHKCVYRQDEFEKLLSSSNWDLNLPVRVREFTLTVQTMGYGGTVLPAVPVAYNDQAVPEDKNDRLLMLTNPIMVGDDVKAVQTKLAALNLYTGSLDGQFGPKTKAAVVAYQEKNGLVNDGIVGKATKAKMGLL